MQTVRLSVRKLLACLPVTLLGAAPALADPPRPAPAPIPAPAPSAAAAADDATHTPLGLIMQQNGGSLFRAEVTTIPVSDLPNDTKPLGAPGSFSAVSLYAIAEPKPKSYKKHDLVTIIAKEQTAFTANGNSKLTKEQDFDAQLQSFIALRPSIMQLHSVIGGGSTFPQIQTTNTRDFNGTGEVDRTDTFSDRVTAEVVDVRPNGTLVLQAVKHIKTDEEDQRMILTGICRAEDVTADNSVLTTQLFDLDLTQSHTGAVSDTTSRGFLPRLLDTFSPF